MFVVTKKYVCVYSWKNFQIEKIKKTPKIFLGDFGKFSIFVNKIIYFVVVN